jgi:hypothetical protein
LSGVQNWVLEAFSLGAGQECGLLGISKSPGIKVLDWAGLITSAAEHVGKTVRIRAGVETH